MKGWLFFYMEKIIHIIEWDNKLVYNKDSELRKKTEYMI